MQSVRHHLNLVVRLCLALVLLGQFAVAAQACAAMQGMAAAIQPAHHCHEAPAPDSKACRIHCLQGDQAPLPAEGLPAQPAVVAEAAVVFAPAVANTPVHDALLALAVDTGPPIPIRYCRFLN